jgi:hypothetical protein
MKLDMELMRNYPPLSLISEKQCFPCSVFLPGPCLLHRRCPSPPQRRWEPPNSPAASSPDNARMLSSPTSLGALPLPRARKDWFPPPPQRHRELEKTDPPHQFLLSARSTWWPTDGAAPPSTPQRAPLPLLTTSTGRGSGATGSWQPIAH